jgi:hypothetical protein
MARAGLYFLMSSTWFDLQDMLTLLVRSRDSVSQTGVDLAAEDLATIRAADMAVWLADELVKNDETSLEFPEKHRIARELAAMGGIDDIDERLRPVEA